MTQFACPETYTMQTITKTETGFTWDIGPDTNYFIMEFDHEGNYIRQFQEDLIDGGLPVCFIVRDVEPLTEVQMRTAIQPTK